ncbi:ribonuclease III [Paenibacillus antri]|uniref:Mini-ribonuclease 3 n=1 Tax=Paenibacillus antri TaxID=2582848 RepID=A0A5R9G6B8_9BACL|nr:ribonuclease III domain-containing protein [Paenibacillus antri]TLS48504.1 ribonuclease III [Paenibacillus antri]
MAIVDLKGFQFFAPAEAPNHVSPLALAYLGDAVYDMYVRQYVLSRPSRRPNQLHRETAGFVSAKAQAKAVRLIEPELSEEERDMLRRGRNAKSHAAPKNTDVLDYRHSTGFECLIGYLYLCRRYDRLERLMRVSVGLESPVAPPAEAENEEKGLTHE